jgi:hypothetical protein
MKTTQFLKVMILTAGLSGGLLLAPGVSSGQEKPELTADTLVVLAKCNQYVQFYIKSNTPDVKIESICKKQKDNSRVDIIINGGTAESISIPNGTFILKGDFGGPGDIKIVNIEKGQGGGQCGSRGPGDSDVRITVPKGCTIKLIDATTAKSCDVCKAKFR